MEIPGGSQGSFQFRTKCFIFIPLSFLSLFSPSGGQGCHWRLGEESKGSRWAESKEDQCGEMGGWGRQGGDGLGLGELYTTWEE